MTHRFEDEWLLRALPGMGLPADVVARLRQSAEPNVAHALLRQNLATWPRLAAALQDAFGVAAVDLSVKEVEKLALALLTQEFCEKLRLIPLHLTNDTIVLAMANPFDLEAKNQVRLLAAREVEAKYALPEKIDALIAECYSNDMLMVDLIERLDVSDKVEFVDSGTGAALEAAGTIERLVNDLITKAVLMEAAEIQMDHGKNASEVRYLLDGMLRTILTLPKAAAAGPVAARIKAMAGLDVSERFRPQEGRVILRIAGREIGLRVFTRIGPQGEKIAVRILDERIAALPLDKLGFRPDVARRIQDTLNQSGLTIVTGPAGSGKTSTLYALLNILKQAEVRLSTVEDPIEFRLSGVAQTQVNEKQGLNYPTAIRAALRADPQALVLGEIRDAETGNLALATAASRRVIASVHTDNGFQALTRLVDMGLAPDKIAPALRLILTQRLARRLCRCRKAEEKPDPALVAAIKAQGFPAVYYRPSGCEECNYTGYRGRIALLEMCEMTEGLKDKILAGASEAELRAAAGPPEFSSLTSDALWHLSGGDTTFAEAAPYLHLDPFRPAAAPEAAPAPTPSPETAGSPRGLETLAEAEAPNPEPDPEKKAATGPRKILVTDDDAIIRAVLRKTLSSQGFAVTEAADGVSALSRIAEDMPDLLLLDLEMPGMDGYGVIRMIRRRMGMNNLPIVMLTAAEDEKNQKQAMELGADDYVLKPFKPAELVNRVQAVFRRSAGSS